MFYSGLTDSDEDDAWVCQNCTETSNIDNTCSECGRARTAAEEVSSTITSVSAEPSVFSSMRNRTGYVYESVCEMHEEIKAPGSDAIHPERPARTRAIHARLEAQGLVKRCIRCPSRRAEDYELCEIHSYDHVRRVNFWSSPENEGQDGPASSDVYVNSSSAMAAALSAGSVIEVVQRVARGELTNAIANVRPPGHHAERSCAMGFCFYNNVAVAAKMAQRNPQIRKVLILDWDIHHGNATENQFLDDPNVLYISLHRYEGGQFYPGTGSPTVVGEGRGAGHNINIGWPHGGVGDVEYLAAFWHIIMPIATSFAPDLVLVSAGFDSAMGDPLGGCSVSPAGYAHMTAMLKSLARGRIVVCLEGGYNLRSISHSMEACVHVLLGDLPLPQIVEKAPSPFVMRSIFQTYQLHQPFWNTLGSFDGVTEASRLSLAWGGPRYRGDQQHPALQEDSKPPPQKKKKRPKIVSRWWHSKKRG